MRKSYPGVTALQDVSLGFAAGLIHAIVGENGAGKSTLIKVMTGATAPDAGQVIIGGTAAPALTPRSAAALGVSVIYQERQIAWDLSVTENLFLGRMPKTRGLIDWSGASRRAQQLLGEIGLEVDVRAAARGLRVAQLQLLEVARALSANARVLILDEPTSTLSGPEIRRLAEVLRSVRERGVAVIYVSHHLDEVLDLADEVSVLRDGRHIVTCPIDEVDSERLVSLIVGREVERMLAQGGGRARPTAGEGDGAAIETCDLHVRPTLRGVSVKARAGEVLCIAGAIGSGRRELARCLAGVERPGSGQVLARGRPIHGPRDAVRRGIAFLSDDRKREGLMLDLSVLDNLMVGALAKADQPLLRPRRSRRAAGELVERLRIKTPSLKTAVRLLSGGNQQKVLLGRWLAVGAETLVFDEPTAGIDVGAKAEIYRLLRQLAREGKTIVISSSDYEEIRLLADRAVVLRRGVVVGELRGEEITEDRLLSLEVA